MLYIVVEVASKSELLGEQEMSKKSTRSEHTSCHHHLLVFLDHADTHCFLFMHILDTCILHCKTGQFWPNNKLKSSHFT
jgi:hypothetical protein